MTQKPGIPGYPSNCRVSPPKLGYPCLNWKSPWQEDTRPGKGIPGDTRSEKGIPCLRRGYHAWEGDTMSEKGIPCLRRGYHWIFKPFRFVCKMKSRWDFLPLPFPNRQMSHYKLFLFLKASLTLSGPLIERTEMKRKIYLSEAWILLWIRLKSPDVGPERVKEAFRGSGRIIFHMF